MHVKLNQTNMKKLFTLALGLIMTMSLSAQMIKGTVVDSDYGDPLIGASVLIKGSTVGTITDVDGRFSLTKPADAGNMLEISYLGYETMVYDLSSGMDLGTVSLKPGMAGLEEVVVTGTMDIVQDRRTPVAVSTIGALEIQEMGGNVEFPDLMKNTPSIYVAGQAGGFGDSEVFTRGFDQTNTAFLLNGQPINGMEDGRMYWSNWSGMTDVATAVQIQRGLGSSKLAISSVGGTTNIIMKPTAQKRGGSVQYTLGNDAYNKVTASYNTGMINDKFGVTALLTHWQGNGWAEGTKGQGQNYFLSMGYKPNNKNNITFLITGAPQWHDQNFNSRISDHFDDDGNFNIKHNGNWGTLDGEYKTSRRNYYHKPVANLNWDMRINDKSTFSTVLYGSWGRGGGTGGIGNSSNRKFTDDGQWDFDAIVAANEASHAAGGNGDEYVLRASVNNHSWYGAVATYENQITDQINFSIGGDVRNYNGTHFRQVANLLGAPSYSQFGTARFPDGREITNTFDPNPWSALSSSADLEDRIAYSNDETINYGGIFGQVEYANENLSAFFQGAVSSQSHVRYELQNETEANEESEKVTNGGFNIKGGASYQFNENNSFYVNAGLYSRQPFHDNIYLNFSNTVNPVTENEDIIGLEAGYKYENSITSLSINAYRTAWNNRTTTVTIAENDTINGVALPNGGFRNLSDVNQLHQGIEVDAKLRVNDRTTAKFFASFGDWKFDGDAVSDSYDDQRQLIESVPSLELDGINVGGAAQTTIGFGADVKVTNSFKIDANVNHYARLYSNLGSDDTELELPAFTLLDLGTTYSHLLSNGQVVRLRANVFNVFGTEYISRATSNVTASADPSENWNGVNQDNFVIFGQTRTWNVSLKYSF